MVGQPKSCSNFSCKWNESHSVMSDSVRPHGLYSPWNFPGQNTGVGNLSLLQGIFPTQGSNPALQADYLPAELSGKPKLRKGCSYVFTSMQPGIHIQIQPPPAPSPAIQYYLTFENLIPHKGTLPPKQASLSKTLAYFSNKL